jgi:hypothetical protein
VQPRLHAAFALALAGCHLYADDGDAPDRGLIPGVFCEQERWFGIEARLRLDLFMIVDDSPSMAVYRDRLLSNVRQFAWVLENVEGGLPSARVAVINTDPFRPTARFLERIVDPWWRCGDDPWTDCIDTSYEGEFADALVEAADIGASGTEIEQPLAIMERALSGELEGLGDRFREVQLVVVLFITDEDDSSPGSVEDYASLLQSRAADTGLVYVAGVVPGGSRGRLPALFDAFPRQGRIGIENDDWVDILADVPDFYASFGDAPCLSGIDRADIDPEEVGLQLDCTVEMSGEVWPRCDMASPTRPDPATALPCYWLDGPSVDGACPTDIEIHFEHALGPREGFGARVRCATSC